MVRPYPLMLALLSLVGWALFLGIVFDRPELFIVAVALTIALLSSSQPADPMDLRICLEVPATRLLEGDPLTISMTLISHDPVPFLEILLPLATNLVPVSGHNRIVLHMRPGEEVRRTVELHSLTRGRSSIGLIHLRTSDRSGLRTRENRLDKKMAVLTYPRVPRVRHLPRPVRTRSSFGNYLSPRLGEGLEPGDIRPFVAGDRARHVNWPASLRLGRLFVTEFHQERNADVVLLLDTYAETGARPNSSLDASVRAAVALAATYLARKDRVGLVELGGNLRWIRPTSGRRHLEGLLQALLPADVMFTYLVRNLDIVPPRVLPPHALVIAISPMIDARFVRALSNLAARRFDLFVLAISPIELTRRALLSSRLTDLACRIWQAEWQVLLDDLRRRGLTILEWDPGLPLESALASLGRYQPIGARIP
jgi:uncharacterized protein (DUF58 family)